MQNLIFSNTVNGMVLRVSDRFARWTDNPEVQSSNSGHGKNNIISFEISAPLASLTNSLTVGLHSQLEE